MADLCNAAGIEPVYTTFDGQSPEDFGDLVEYCWGSANTTYGRMRIETDGHPEPYRIKYFECAVSSLATFLPSSQELFITSRILCCNTNHAYSAAVHATHTPRAV